jgi:hypothetical protein
MCSGENYSPKDQPGQTVAVGLMSSMPTSAVVDFPACAMVSWSGCPPTPPTWVKDSQCPRNP